MTKKKHTVPSTWTCEGWRYMTLEEARSLTCNQCGDCCDPGPYSLRWGTLPSNQYRDLNGGKPLIVPLLKGGRTPRQWVPSDGREGASVPFTCTALMLSEDDCFQCGIHGSERPEACSMFPLWYPTMGAQALSYPLYLRTGGLARCTWNSTLILPLTSPILSRRDEAMNVDWDTCSGEDQDLILQSHHAARTP